MESRELRQFVEGTDQMIGVLPTGLGPGNGEKPLASLFFSAPVARQKTVLEAGLDAWKRHVRRIAPPSEELLDQITDTDHGGSRSCD